MIYALSYRSSKPLAVAIAARTTEAIDKLWARPKLPSLAANHQNQPFHRNRDQTVLRSIREAENARSVARDQILRLSRRLLSPKRGSEPRFIIHNADVTIGCKPLLVFLYLRMLASHVVKCPSKLSYSSASASYLACTYSSHSSNLFTWPCACAGLIFTSCGFPSYEICFVLSTLLTSANETLRNQRLHRLLGTARTGARQHH